MDDLPPVPEMSKEVRAEHEHIANQLGARVIQVDEYAPHGAEYLATSIGLSHSTSMLLLDRASTAFKDRVIRFSVVDAGVPNAWACKGQLTDHVFITQSLIDKLYGLCLGLMSTTYFLPDLGNAPQEQIRGADSRVVSQVAPSLSRDIPVNAEELYLIPKDERRWLFAQTLLFNAISWVLSHEVGHVLSGHLDYAHSLRGHGVISEREHSLSGGVPLAIVETDADLFASVFVGGTLQGMDWHPDQEVFAWSGVKEEDIAVVSGAIAVYLLFVCLGSRTPITNPMDLASYPHPAVRAITAIRIPLATRAHRGGDAESARKAVQDAILSAEAAIARNGGPHEERHVPSMMRVAELGSHALFRQYAKYQDELYRRSRIDYLWRPRFQKD